MPRRESGGGQPDSLLDDSEYGEMSSSKSSSPTAQGGKDRRETLLQRRERILGAKSLRYVQPTQISTKSSKDKRRDQVLQAQRVHRQRTLDYIEELEAEIIRLRGSKAPTTPQNDHLQGPEPLPLYDQPSTSLTLNALIRCLNGQVAPGLLIRMDTSQMLEPADFGYNDIVSDACEVSRDPARMHPLPCLEDMFLNSDASIESLIGFELPSPLNLHLESFDSLTRRLFLNFSENIAPTLVPFDGPSNGYRTILLPFACDNELVRGALLAASANHIRFKEAQLTKLAFTLQASSIEQLSSTSKLGQYNTDCILSILATIVLLLIAGMMNGPDSFQAVYNIAKSWMKFMGETQEPIRSHLANFLRNEIQMIETYAQPMLSGKLLIASTYQNALTSPLNSPTRTSNIYESFYALESAIKQACSIYTGHVLSDSPPQNVDELLKELRNTVEDLPDHLPGENALAWVYFIGAAESSTPFSRNFFAKRLMGIYERGNAADVTTSFHLLHLIWNRQLNGGSWTEVLKQMPLIFK